MNPQENEQTQLLREILKWIKFAGMKQVKEELTSVLNTPQKALAYQFSDGSKGIVEVRNATGIASNATISAYWKSWLKLGLGENVAVKGGERFKRGFDLEDFGMEVPLVKKATSEEKKSETPEPLKEEKQTSQSVSTERPHVPKEPEEGSDA